MQNYQAWLETPNLVRIALVQAQSLDLSTGITTTRYLSTHAVTVSGQEYLPIIRGQITIDESISTSYAASISYGDIELANNAGDYDSWLDYAWGNKSVNIYIGSMPVPGTLSVLDDFQLIFSGLSSDLDSKSRTTLNLKIRDKLEKLNTSISETLLDNYNPRLLVNWTNPYANNLKPVCFGEVHNITPLLTEAVLLEYMVNSLSVEKIIEVRDNGVPVSFTVTSASNQIPAGSFRLKASPIGTITCSVQGYNKTINIGTSGTTTTYNPSAANTIATILNLYGQTVSFAELDSSSFSLLGAEAVGVYLSDRINVLTICQEIAKSCGLILTTTRTGKLKLVDLAIPTGAITTITEADMLLNTLAISERPDVIAGVKLGYAKNYTIQNTLTTQIPQQHKDLYATEWLESLSKDDTVKLNYSVTIEPALQSTYLINKVDADKIGNKILKLFSTRRKVLTMTCIAKLLSVQVGDAVKVTASRFNLNNGAFGIVVSTKPNWLRGIIEIGVLV